MIVAIHQPNFLPWLGYFSKMACADTFIFLDTVPFTKHGFQNRVKIKSRDGARWLTVPILSSGRFGQLTNEVEINNTGRWRDQHLNTLRTEYGAAPFSRPTLELLGDSYESGGTNLARFNLSLLAKLTDCLDLKRRFVLASELGGQGAGSELLLRLVLAVGGNIYLSGPSGRDYLDCELFNDAGVEIRFHEFRHSEYPQLHGPFVERLSSIDLLMNVGVEGARDYLGRVDARSEHDAAAEGVRA